MSLDQRSSPPLAPLFYPILHSSSHVNYLYVKVLQGEREMKPCETFPRLTPFRYHSTNRFREEQRTCRFLQHADAGAVATSEHQQRRVLQAAGRVRRDKIPCYAPRYGLRVY